MKTTNLQPSNELTALCNQVGSLRRYLVKQRTSLPAPGYHLDLNLEAAAKTREFLDELPAHCRTLRSALREFQRHTSADHFKAVTDFLQNLEDDPTLFFREPTLEVFQSLRAENEHLASIGIDLDLLQGKEPTLC